MVKECLIYQENLMLECYIETLNMYQEKLYTVIPRYIVVHLSQLHCFVGFVHMYMYFYIVDFPL